MHIMAPELVLPQRWRRRTLLPRCSGYQCPRNATPRSRKGEEQQDDEGTTDGDGELVMRRSRCSPTGKACTTGAQDRTQLMSKLITSTHFPLTHLAL
jgi:hypothetical protein